MGIVQTLSSHHPELLSSESPTISPPAWPPWRLPTPILAESETTILETAIPSTAIGVDIHVVEGRLATAEGSTVGNACIRCVFNIDVEESAIGL